MSELQDATAAVTALVTGFGQTRDQLAELLSGPADGGPAGDGRYPVTMADGSTTRMVPSPSKIAGVADQVAALVRDGSLLLLVEDRSYAAKGDLDANLAPAADKWALVHADADPSHNGFYTKLGATGAGSWALKVPLDGAQAAQALIDGLGVTHTGWPRGAFPYWRVLFTGSKAGYTCLIADMELRAVPSGSAIAVAAQAIASGTGAPDGATTYQPENAFDGNLDSRWASNTAAAGSWLGLHYATPVSVNQVAITAPAGLQAGAAPTGGHLQYSINGATWTTAWSFENTSDWPQTSATRVFTDPLYGQESKVVVLGSAESGKLFLKHGDQYQEIVVGGGGSSGKSASTQALIAAIQQNGSFPVLAPQAADQPVVTVGTANTPTAIGTSVLRPAGVNGVLRPPYAQRFGVARGRGGSTDSYFGSMMEAKGAYRGGGASDQSRWGGGHSAWEWVLTGSDMEIAIVASGGGAGCRLLVNDRIAWTGDIPTDSNGHLIRVTFPSGGTRRISWETRNMLFSGVRVAPGSTITPAPVRPWISWTGDSFPDGAGGVDYANGTLPAIGGRALGCACNVVAVGGTGLLSGGAGAVPYTDANRLADLTMAGTGITPAMGVISGSNNDGGSSPGYLQSAITGASAKCIEAWLAAHDGTPLVLIGPWDVAGQAASPLPLSAYYIRDGMQQAAFQYRAHNVHFLDQLVPDLMVGLPTVGGSQSDHYTYSDEVHPSQAGSEMRGLWHAGQLERLITTAFA